MNMWGFTPSVFTELEQRFKTFLKNNASNPIKSEFFLPNVVNDLLIDGKARVKILPTDEKWFGVTYPDDRPLVQAAIQRMIELGNYPSNLWDA